MEDLFEMRDRLNELSNRVEDYKTCHKDILTTKDEYVALRKTKPSKKPEKKVKRPFLSAPVRVALLVVLMLCLVFCATWCAIAFFLYLIGSIFSMFGVAVVGVITTVLVVIALVICSFGAWGISFVVFLLIVEVIYNFLSKYFYRRAVKKYEANKKYNEEVYPVLLEAYCDEEELLKKEYDLLTHKAQLKIDTDEEFFKEKGDIIAKKYYLDLDRIIDAIDAQRADSLSDAINLVIRDKRLENAGKQKKRDKAVHNEGIYPSDILIRASVFSSNCERCPKADTCIKLWCRMNDYFRRLDEDELDKIIFEETGEIQIVPELKEVMVAEIEAPKAERAEEQSTAPVSEIQAETPTEASENSIE